MHYLLALLLSTSIASTSVTFDNRIDFITITPIIYKLKTKHVTDVYLTTPGGEVWPGLFLLNQLNKYQPTLHIRHTVASMGANILCAYKGKKDIPDKVIILFHTISYGNEKVTTRNLFKFSKATQHTYHRMRALLADNCANAFTDAEWVAMWDYGKDIIMSGETYKKRMHLYNQ